MFANYGALSTEVYTLTKPVGHSIDGDIEYYSARLQTVTGKILEAGVGTGRLLIPLLQQGYDIDGVDYSAEMLEICAQACQMQNLKPTLYQQDLVNLKLNQLYDAIIMPTGSFGLIANRDAARSVLHNFYQHLAQGGRIILDLAMPCDFTPNEVCNHFFTLNETTGIRMESISQNMDWIAQKTTTVLKYEKWEKGQLIQTELQDFTLSWYGVEEFTLLLQQIGFNHISCSANYRYQQSPTSSSDILTFEATK